MTTATSRNTIRLSDREMDVLRLVAKGNPNRAIANTLKMSEHTVKAVVSRVLVALQARDRAHAVGLAFAAELLSAADLVNTGAEASR